MNAFKWMCLGYAMKCAAGGLFMKFGGTLIADHQLMMALGA